MRIAVRTPLWLAGLALMPPADSFVPLKLRLETFAFEGIVSFATPVTGSRTIYVTDGTKLDVAATASATSAIASVHVVISRDGHVVATYDAPPVKAGPVMGHPVRSRTASSCDAVPTLGKSCRPTWYELSAQHPTDLIVRATAVDAQGTHSFTVTYRLASATLDIAPTSVGLHGTASLSWSTHNAQSVTLKADVGTVFSGTFPVAASGHITVTGVQAGTQTYSLIVTPDANALPAFGCAQAPQLCPSRTLTVSSNPAPPTTGGTGCGKSLGLVPSFYYFNSVLPLHMDAFVVTAHYVGPSPDASGCGDPGDLIFLAGPYTVPMTSHPGWLTKPELGEEPALAGQIPVRSGTWLLTAVAPNGATVHCTRGFGNNALVTFHFDAVPPNPAC